MRVRYNKNSEFLLPIEEFIYSNLGPLNAGSEIVIWLQVDTDGYGGSTVVTITSQNTVGFESDIRLSQEGRFPARIKAAATALHNNGCIGNFRIIHKEGFVRIKKV